MSYIPFTDEQKILANSIDLAEYLRVRGEKLERVGIEHKLIYYDSSGKHDSITIRGSKWFDHKNQIGGGAIKFMQEFYDMDFQTAVQELLGQTVTPLSHSPPKVSAKEEKKEFRLPEANTNMHRVYAYLIKQRFISPDIISHFAKQHTLYEDKEHHNAVFVGVDENGVPRQASKRSTNSYGNSFRITCQGSDTRYSFAHFGESKRLYVFEAPIDMMSFLTLYPKDWQKHSCIAMNGVYENAVLAALKNHSNLSEVILCVDNDEGGIEAVDRLRDILNENGYSNVKCRPDKLTSQIYAAFKNKQYKYLAEYALAGSAFFIDKSCEKDMFAKLRAKLKAEYKPYTDKGKAAAKQRNLQECVTAVMKDLRQTARTREQCINTAKLLYQLADSAVRLSVEKTLYEPVAEHIESEDIVCEPEPCMEFG